MSPPTSHLGGTRRTAVGVAPRGQERRGAGDDAVADVLGSILLVGITVLMMVALGALLFSMDGPSDTVHADVAPVLRPGPDGQWGTGDESVVLEHRGGEPLPRDGTRVRVRIGDTTTETRDAALDGGFSDGRLTLGERWTFNATIGLDDAVAVDVVNAAATSGIVASGKLAAPNAQPRGCLPDGLAPSVLTWTLAPADLLSSTLGGLGVEIQASDDCSGVDDAVAPRLHWRIVGLTAPAFTDQGAMTGTGGGVWTVTVPAPALGWSSVAESTLELYVSGLTDLAGNVGNSTVESETIDLAGTTTYVSSAWAVTGTVANLANAQSASDGGAAARLTEAASGNASATSSFSADGVVSATGWTDAANGFASDDQYATVGGNTPASLQYLLADAPSSTSTISAVVLKAEVKADKASSDWFLQPCLTACGTESADLGNPTTDTVLSYDVTALRPGGGSWSWSDVSLLQVVVRAAGTGNPAFSVDHVHVEVTASGATHRMEVRLNVTGLPAATSHTLSVRHASTGDTFDLEVLRGLVWTDLVALDATTATTSTATLSALDVVGGVVHLRVVDDTAGAAQGTVDLDWVRVVST